jgi:hypothetical protein
MWTTEGQIWEEVAASLGCDHFLPFLKCASVSTPHCPWNSDLFNN